jgi:hypothetical protein
MTMGLLFWILMLLWLLFGAWYEWPNHYRVGWSFMLFILLLILGWHSFGPPVHG